MGENTAFFYGTLMAPPVLHRVCFGPSPLPHQLLSLTIHPAVLPGHRRHRVRGHDYPGLIPSEDRSALVRGTYVTGLTEGDLWRLDIFEGDEYSRQKGKVRLLDEGGADVKGPREVETETYLWVAGEGLLEEGEWDIEHFVRERMGRWVAEYPSFADVDNAVRAQGGNVEEGGGGTNGDVGARTVSKEEISSAV